LASDSIPLSVESASDTAIVALSCTRFFPSCGIRMLGLTGIDPRGARIRRAMGMTRAQILFRVRFPLASRSILAGIRTATIITIGVATIAAAIGAAASALLSFAV